MKENLLKQCWIIEDHCRYNAETHHLMALKERKKARWARSVPAIVTAISGIFAIQNPNAPMWDWLTLTGAVTTTLASVFEFEKSYQSNIDAAKNFTVLKHETSALRTAFSDLYDEARLTEKVECFLERYLDVVRSAPPTDSKMFDAARKNIKDGRHDVVPQKE